jgi:hypothetical protein
MEVPSHENAEQGDAKYRSSLMELYRTDPALYGQPDLEDKQIHNTEKDRSEESAGTIPSQQSDPAYLSWTSSDLANSERLKENRRSSRAIESVAQTEERPALQSPYSALRTSGSELKNWPMNSNRETEVEGGQYDEETDELRPSDSVSHTSSTKHDTWSTGNIIQTEGNRGKSNEATQDLRLSTGPDKYFPAPPREDLDNRRRRMTTSRRPRPSEGFLDSIARKFKGK